MDIALSIRLNINAILRPFFAFGTAGQLSDTRLPLSKIRYAKECPKDVPVSTGSIQIR